MAEYKVKEACFFGRRYKPGDILVYEGDKVPSYLEKIEEENPFQYKLTKKEKVVTE